VIEMAKSTEETVKVIVLRDGQSVGKKTYKKHDQVTIKKRLFECHKECFELVKSEEKAAPKKAVESEVKQDSFLGKAAE
jgi:hypothetical protein